MKTYYLFVPDGDNVTVNSVVVWFFAGSSRREQTRLKLLETYANDVGAFLRKRDEDTDFWLISRAKSLFPDSNCPLLHFSSAQMSVIDLYRKVLDGSLDLYVKNKEMQRNSFNTLSILDANFMRSHNLKNVTQRVPNSRRNYLSHSVDGLIQGSAIVAALLVIGFLTDFLGTFIIKLLFG